MIKRGNKSTSGFAKRDGKPYGCIIIDLVGAGKLANLENWLQKSILSKHVGRGLIKMSWLVLVPVGMMMMMVAS